MVAERCRRASLLPKGTSLGIRRSSEEIGDEMQNPEDLNVGEYRNSDPNRPREHLDKPAVGTRRCSTF